MELKRTSQSWDGAELPDYPVGKPELVVKRYVFPRGSKLGWHHHPVMNYGIVQQGELTIIGVDGKEKTVRAGEPRGRGGRRDGRHRPPRREPRRQDGRAGHVLRLAEGDAARGPAS